MKKNNAYNYNKWYLRSLAIFYFSVLSLMMIVYFHHWLSSDGWRLPVSQTILFLFAFLSSLLYLIRPAVGYWGLVFVTISALIMAGNDSNLLKGVFHVAVLILLFFPFFEYLIIRKHKKTEEQELLL